MRADPMKRTASRNHLDLSIGLFAKGGRFKRALPRADDNDSLPFELSKIVVVAEPTPNSGRNSLEFDGTRGQSC